MFDLNSGKTLAVFLIMIVCSFIGGMGLVLKGFIQDSKPAKRTLSFWTGAGLIVLALMLCTYIAAVTS